MKYQAYKLALLISLAFTFTSQAQNSMVGDGFGGRLWYKPTNYTVGSYSGYSICYSGPCNSGVNQLYGWGSNGTGQLGYDPNITPFSNTPIPIPGMTDVKYYSTGYNMGAIKNDGTGWVWGTGLYTNPTNVMANGTVKSVGANMALILGMLGIGDSIASQVLIPTGVLTLNNIVDIKAHTYAVAALDANGDVYVWGDGNCIGDGYNIQKFLPKKISTLKNIVAISGCADGFHFLALDSDKICYAWGMNFLLFL